MRIRHYHLLKFSSETLGVVRVQEFTESENNLVIRLLKGGVTLNKNRPDTASLGSALTHSIPIRDLKTAILQQEGTVKRI